MSRACTTLLLCPLFPSIKYSLCIRNFILRLEPKLLCTTSEHPPTAWARRPLILHISVTLPPMPSHPRRLSPPRRASSSSAAQHPQSMAYPFPRFSSAPQTPQYLKSVESPNSWQSRGFDKPRSYPTRWLLLLLAAAVVFIFLLARSFAAHPWQTDRIPFSKSDMDE